jgi:hypothetical protein
VKAALHGDGSLEQAWHADRLGRCKSDPQMLGLAYRGFEELGARVQGWEHIVAGDVDDILPNFSMLTMVSLRLSWRRFTVKPSIADVGSPRRTS